MKAIVLGLGNGDEGKGLTVEYLYTQMQHPLVVRFSGGGQAGHNVKHEDGFAHTFSNFGSASALGAATYWSQFCPVDPTGILNEYATLQSKGITPRLYLNPKSPLVTPLDKYYNKFNDTTNGTVGVGIGSTLQREKNNYSLLVGDIKFPEIFKHKYMLIVDYYQHLMNLPEDKTSIQSCLDLFMKCDEVRSITTHFMDEQVLQGDIIFEGSQGLMLDKSIGFFPHVTYSDVTSRNALEMIKGVKARIDPVEIYLRTQVTELHYYLVTRAYLTRHGNGPMLGQEIDMEGKFKNPFEANKTEQYQGKFRTAYLNVDALEYAMERDAGIRHASPYQKTLVITCLDVMEGNYKFYYRGELKEFESKEDFLTELNKILLFKNILISESPYSKNITRWL